MADFSPSGTKICTKCKTEKALSEFYQYRNRKHRVGTNLVAYSACRTCCVAKAKRYADNNREKIKARRDRARAEGRGLPNKGWRDRHLKRLYNTNHLAYDLQLQGQHGCCAICGRPPAEGERRFPFDHDHSTGLTRGVLCSACNGGLGCFRDRPDLLRNALTYLADWAARHSMEQASGF